MSMLTEDAAVVDAKPDLGKFSMTFYYVAAEGDEAPARPSGRPSRSADVRATAGVAPGGAEQVDELAAEAVSDPAQAGRDAPATLAPGAASPSVSGGAGSEPGLIGFVPEHDAESGSKRRAAASERRDPGDDAGGNEAGGDEASGDGPGGDEPSGDDPAAHPDAVLANAVTGTRVTLYDPECGPISEVNRDFAMDAQMQGTGRLRDGRLINIWGECSCPRSPCFKVIGKQWGRGGSGRALVPYRSVAVDPKVVALGSLLYIPELDGMKMPGPRPWGGFVHDGCVSADDTGGAIRGNEIDFFVGKRAMYRAMSRRGGSHRWAKSLTVLPGDGHCERRNGRVVHVRNAL